MDISELGRKFVDWIHLALNTVQWWVLVDTVMNLLFHVGWEFCD